MKSTGNWDKIFAEAHLHSWPVASLTIQNRNPNPDNDTARNVFKEDKEEILKAAFRNGYRRIATEQDNMPMGPKAVSFVNSEKKGELYT